MPHPTFFNLPDVKRDQIMQVVLDEFASHDYDDVSISRIVARAGIAKGSFYQYFSGKDDLYSYVLGLVAEAKTRMLSLDHPDPQHVGIFAYLRWTIEAGVAFSLAYPQFTEIGIRAASAKTLPPAFAAQLREATAAFYGQLVMVGKQQGDIDADVDGELSVVVFDAVMNSVGQHVLSRIAGADRTPGQDSRMLLERPELKALFNSAVGILEHGMRGRVNAQGGQ